MAHPFDELVDATRAAIMSTPGLLHVGQIEVRGATFPIFDSAPEDLPSFFAQTCALYADRECLVDGNDRLTFREVHALATALAAALIDEHGIRPGDPVGLAGRNGAGWVIAYMGIVMAGGIATLINAFWTGPEMASAVRDVGCKLVLADRFRLDALEACSEASDFRLLLLDLEIPVAQALASLSLERGPVPLPSPGGDAAATILFTSGSTGQCKGAVSDHRAKVQATLSFACSVVAVAALLTQQDQPPRFLPATLLSLPLFHVTGEVNVMLHSFALGRKMVVMRRWDALEALRLIEAERITYVTGVPLMSVELAAHPERSRFDLSSLTDIAAGGAPRPPEQLERLRTGLPDAWPSFGYGLTETNAIGTGLMRQTTIDVPHSPGKATPPLVDVAIFDETGEALPVGTIGNIGVRSVANILGYWNRPEENARLFTASGHVLTGDLGRLDEAGYLTIVGREKDIIIRGGENIAAPEVESALYAIPAILECAVFGVPDQRMGEVPVAVVHLAAASDLDEAGIVAALNGRLASYKRPVRILIHDGPLPRLGSEKINKAALREAYLSAV